MSAPETNVDQVEETIGSPEGPIVVAYDSSRMSKHALSYAAAEAAERGLPLRIVSAFTVVTSDLGLGAGAAYEAETAEALRQAAQNDAEDAVAWVAEHYPDLTVEKRSMAGPAAAVIIENSAGSSLLVVGSHGHGGFLGMLLGGVSREVATHSKVPTIVVRDTDYADNRVVVGVDGSPDSLRALAFAFDMASRYGAPLVAVHTWEVPPIGAITGVPTPEPPELIQDMADNELRTAAEELAGFGERYPDVVVEQKIVRGSPVKVLCEEAQDSRLLVVGSRGRGGFLGLLLGSVSHGVLHHATCNVAVVRKG